MRRIYWDSCIVIYRIQAVAPWAEKVAQLLEPAEEARLFYTDLTRLECRVLPMREGDSVLLALYERFFTRPDVTRIPLSREVFDYATTLRARHRIKTPDALHIAAAIVAGCEEFWTNDRDLEKAAEGRLKVVAINDLP